MKDGLFFQATYGQMEGGDVSQYFDPADALPALRVQEVQEPLLLAGYHREWRPGSHTLLLGSYVDDTLEYSNPDQSVMVLERSRTGRIAWVYPGMVEQQSGNRVQLGSAEVQQIEQLGSHALIVGGRYQRGTFQTSSAQANVVSQDFDSDFERLAAYAYDQWQLVPALGLTAGLSYDWLTFPENFRSPPLSPDPETRDQVSPKVGAVWTPHRHTTVRAAYAQSLGGASLDQSVRLEPAQVAGFLQAPRSLIPESVAGANACPTFEIAGLSLEQKLGRGTYLGLSGEWLRSEVRRAVGAIEFDPRATTQYTPSQTREELDFRERTVMFTADQLLGDGWALGARYRLSLAELERRFPDVATAQFYPPYNRQDMEALLHQVELSAIYNHSCGAFGQVQSLWSSQDNRGYGTPGLPGDDFWQVNLLVGYRFLQRRGEVRLGLLNLTDQDYRLNPLNLTPELPPQPHARREPPAELLTRRCPGPHGAILGSEAGGFD